MTTRRLLLIAALALVHACRRDVDGRTLSIGYPRGLASLNPHDDAHEQYSAQIQDHIYESLVEVGPDLSVRPGLAESWYCPDEQSWVFTLRRQVLLHDGHTLAAADIVRSFEVARKGAWLRSELEPITSVVARGEREVVFKTRIRFETLPSRLLYFYVGGEAGPGGIIPGTGPYRLVRREKDGSALLEAFAGHRRGQPAIRRVHFRVVPDAAERARLLLRGDVHLVADVRPVDVPVLRDSSGVVLVERRGLRVMYLGMDCARPSSPYVTPRGNPFLDRRVREAIDLAVDPKSLVEGPLGGHAETVSQLPLSDEVGFEPSLAPTAVDRSRSRQLLREAGWGAGFTVVLDVMRGGVDGIEVEIARQLAEVGISVQPRSSPSAGFLGRLLSRDTSFYLVQWLNTSRSAHETYSVLLSSVHPTVWNSSGYADARLDALLDDASREPVPAHRADLLRRATRLVDEERPLIPLYRRNDLFAHRQDLVVPVPAQGPILATTLRWR
jgi:peptide/nickel transport system substrate-binding protein